MVKAQKNRVSSGWVTASLVLLCFGVLQPVSASVFFPASNPNIQYVGRCKASAYTTLGVADNMGADWPGFQVFAKFQGTSITAQIETGWSRQDFLVLIDGQLYPTLECDCWNPRPYHSVWPIASGLADTTHTILLVKRIESWGQTVVFEGFFLDDGKTLVAPPVRPNRRMEIIGDSTPAGYGMEGDYASNFDTPHNCNSYYAFGPMMARIFNADYHQLCASGICLVKGTGANSNFPPFYDQTIERPNSYDIPNNTWNFSSWQADAVIVSIGGNDKPFSGSDQSLMETAYYNFIKTIRSKHPNAHIFCINNSGWDYGSAGDYHTLMQYIADTVNRLNSEGDSKVYWKDAAVPLVTFPAPLDSWYMGAEGHMNIAGNALYAKQLMPWISSKTGWTESIPVDVSSPTAPGAVRCGNTFGSNISQFTLDADGSISANWDPASDPQSGVIGYIYSIGTSPGTVDAITGVWWGGWLCVGSMPQPKVTVKFNSDYTGKRLTVGQTYYFTVRAINGVGMIGPASMSSGQLASASGVTYTLSASVNPQGTGSVTLTPSGGTYSAGTVVTLTASAGSGYTFTSWSGAASGSANPATVTVNSNSSATANFGPVQPNSYTLSITANPPAGGTVNLNPFAASYAAGTVVTLTAAANSGYSFSSWSGAAGGTSNTVSVTVSANSSATANFAYTPPASSYTLDITVSPAGSGMVGISPSQAAYTAGTSVTLTATANTGYSFTSWTGSATGASQTAQVTMSSNKTVTAVFSQNQQTPVVQPPDAGAIVNGMYSFADPTADTVDFMVKLGQATNVNLKIYTVTGKLLNSISQTANQGDNIFTFSNLLASGKRMSKGLYIYCMVATDASSGACETRTGKFIVP